MILLVRGVNTIMCLTRAVYLGELTVVYKLIPNNTRSLVIWSGTLYTLDLGNRC